MTTIRILDEDDAPGCLALSRQHGWIYDERRWRLMLGLGTPYGINDPDGGLAGTVTRFDLGDGLAAIGMMLVALAHQRRGLGRRLMERALGDAGPRTVLLYATPQGRPLYDRLGFAVVGTSTAWTGRVSDEGGGHSPVRPMTAADLPAVAAFDAQAFGAPRAAILRALHRTSVRALVREDGGRVVAYGLATPNAGTVAVGPIVATDEAQAVALARDLSAGWDAPLRIDLSSERPLLAAWARGAGLQALPPVPLMTWSGTGVPGHREMLMVIANRAIG